MSQENTKPKKKISGLTIAIVLILVLCLGGFGVIKYTESQTVKAITSFLTNSSNPYTGSVESVTFSFFNKELVIKNLTLKSKTADAEMPFEYNIALTTIQNPQLAALNPKTQGQPLVADRIIFENFVAISNGMKSTIEKYIIEDWKQNLGKVTEALAKGQDSPEFWEAVYDYSMGLCGYTNQTAEMLSPNGDTAVALSVASSGITNAKGRDMNWFMNDFHVTVRMENPATADSAKTEDIVTFHLGRIELKNLYAPTPANMAELMKVGLTSPEQLDEKQLMNTFISIMKDYKEKAPYSDFILSDMKVTVQENTQDPIQLVTIKNITNTLHSMPYIFGIELNGIEIQADNLEKGNLNYHDGLDFAQSIESLKLDKLVFDSKFKSTLSDNLKELSIETSNSAENLGAQKINFKIDFPIPLTEMNIDNFEEAIVTSRLDGASYSYEDKGLIPRFINSLSAEMEEDSATTIESVMTLIDEASAEYPPFVTVFDALKNNLLNPGTFEISMPAGKPLDFTSLIMALAIAPQKLGLQVKYTSHGKSIDQLINEL